MSAVPLRLLRHAPPPWRVGGCFLLAAFLAVTAGCAHEPAGESAPPAPVYHPPPGLWQRVDADISSASATARHEAEACARVAMDEWRWRVRQLIEETFIPWYSGYWTQQWVSVRLAWYNMQSGEGEPDPEERLVRYLQAQFYEQVLEPVSAYVDPDTVMEQATEAYLRELRMRVERLPPGYRIPPEAFRQHLDTIPAINLPPPAHGASLREVLEADHFLELPAARALFRQFAQVGDPEDSAGSFDRLHVVARRAVTRLVDRIALRGGATAASTFLGGVWGVMISAGAAVWSAVEHDSDRPVLEAQLRDNLDAALDLMWHDLVEDQAGGVFAPVWHMSGTIETSLPAAEPAPPSPRNAEDAPLF